MKQVCLDAIRTKIGRDVSHFEGQEIERRLVDAMRAQQRLDPEAWRETDVSDRMALASTRASRELMASAQSARAGVEARYLREFRRGRSAPLFQGDLPPRRWQAALRDPRTGEVYLGANHAAARDMVPLNGDEPASGASWDDILSDQNTGFVNAEGVFHTREDAYAALSAATDVKGTAGERVNERSNFGEDQSATKARTGRPPVRETSYNQAVISRILDAAEKIAGEAHAGRLPFGYPEQVAAATGYANGEVIKSLMWQIRQGYYGETLAARAGALQSAKGGNTGGQIKAFVASRMDEGLTSRQILERLNVFQDGNSWKLSNLASVRSMVSKIKRQRLEGNSLFQGDGAPGSGVKGAFQPGPEGGAAGSVIHIFESGDVSTAIHEGSHWGLEVFADYAARAEAPAALKADWQRVLDFLGVVSRDDMDTAALETWARATERYLMEGKAPQPELEGLFAQIKSWFTAIYREIINLNVELTPEIRGVFDRLLKEEADAGTGADLRIGRRPGERAAAGDRPEPRGDQRSGGAADGDPGGGKESGGDRAQTPAGGNDVAEVFALAPELKGLSDDAEAARAEVEALRAEGLIDEELPPMETSQRIAGRLAALKAAAGQMMRAARQPLFQRSAFEREIGLVQPRNYDARDLVLMFNEAMTDAQIAAELSLDVRDVDAATVSVQLSRTRTAVRNAMEIEGGLARLAELMRVDQSELTNLVDNAKVRRQPSLAAEARRLIRSGVTEAGALAAGLKRWAQSTHGVEPADFDAVAALARSREGVTQNTKNTVTSPDMRAEIERRRMAGESPVELRAAGFSQREVHTAIAAARGRGVVFPPLRDRRAPLFQQEETDAIRAAVGDMFSPEEVDAMLKRLSARFARLKTQAAKTNADDPALWREAFETLAVEEARDHLIQARMQAAGALARAGRDDFYGRFSGDRADALRARMVGDEGQGDMRGLSVDAIGKAAEVEFQSRFTEALEDKNHLNRLASPMQALAPDRAFEEETVREIARLNGEARAPSENKAAREVAEIIIADQRRARETMNRLGAWIGELPGYVSRTTHDGVKISGGFWKGMNAARRAEARDGWRDFIGPLLAERTFEAVDEQALMALRQQIESNVTAEPAAIGQLVARDAPAAIAAARGKFLETIWTDIVSGFRAADHEFDDLDSFRPPSSMARQLSGRRVLHFKGADEWLAYNRAFGLNSLYVAHLSFLQRAGRNEALMRTFGPSPEAAFRADRARLTQMARDAGDVAAVKKLENWRREGEFDQISGRAEAAVSHRAATVSRAIRSWMGLTRLGGMVLSSPSDLGNGAQALSRAGVKYLDAYSGMAGSLVNATPVVRDEVANLVGEGARAMAGDIAAQFTAPDSNLGWMFKAQRLFYRANLFHFWQARLRRGAGTVLAKHLGARAELGYAALEPQTRAGLLRYGIDRDAWELARTGVVDLEEHGGRVLTPDAAERADGDALAHWAGKRQVWDDAPMMQGRRAIADAMDQLNGAGRTLNPEVSWTGLSTDKRQALAAAGVTRGLWDRLRAAATAAGDARVEGAAIDRVTRDVVGRELNLAQIFRPDDVADARRELMLRLQAYFTDTIDNAMTEPRARERALMRMGTRTGTALGTALELFMQFKSFPLTVMTRHLGPAVADAKASGVIAPLVHFMMSTTALGFVAMQMKDLARGLKPAPLVDEEGNPNLSLFVRAFVQGGGGGLYADFLTGDYDRFGRSPWASLAGPSVGEAERVLKIFTELRDGNFGDAGADALRMGVDNTPFVSVFYTRWALNYWLLYGMQESISPGYLQRMEDRVRDTRAGQEYYYPPSEMTR